MPEERVKKKWSKPKLIVLVRGKPEEAVLDTCKTTVFGVLGPLPRWPRCASGAGREGTQCYWFVGS